jgi:hypothetical protein
MEDNKIIKVSELKKDYKCIIKNKVYIITAIWIVPTLTTNGLYHKNRFVLYCEDDKTKTEKIYPNNFELEIDTNNGYIKMD